MNEWISVKDRLPKEYESVLILVNAAEECKDDLIFVGYWHTRSYARKHLNCVWGDGYVPFKFEDITHWMSLPKPPEVP